MIQLRGTAQGRESFWLIGMWEGAEMLAFKLREICGGRVTMAVAVGEFGELWPICLADECQRLIKCGVFERMWDVSEAAITAYIIGTKLPKDAQALSDRVGRLATTSRRVECRFSHHFGQVGVQLAIDGELVNRQPIFAVGQAIVLLEKKVRPFGRLCHADVIMALQDMLHAGMTDTISDPVFRRLTEGAARTVYAEADLRRNLSVD